MTTEKKYITEPAAKKTQYEAKIGIADTQDCIYKIKEFFPKSLSSNLSLRRVSAPLYVLSESGLNDNLNGYERPVSFDFKGGEKAQIVHSLAKWKRMALGKYGFAVGTGLYTDMNAIRRDEDLTAIHSYYVDQWDWELVISREERTIEKLKDVVRKIYASMKDLESYITELYPMLDKKLAESISFFTTQELEDAYPDLTPKEREDAICRKHGSVFLMQVGKVLKSGSKHDGRAPDYDDWEMNGDILVYYAPLDIGLELSSMGIRVDEDSLLKQLKLSGAEDRITQDFHKSLLNHELPYTIGGGIGQSRLCMFIMDKQHIGEVQVSIWPKSTVSDYASKGLFFL